MVHDVARAGFSDPADYEAARPGYPPDAVAFLSDRLRIAPGKTVIDLAAGTGKFTRLLPQCELIAVEPVEGMRATFRTILPDIPLVSATAEQLPFEEASVDAVTVAQAWHWFDHDRAGSELARVVRPGGAIALVWNARDRSVAWVDAVWSIIDRVEKKAPWRDHEHWRESAPDIPGFEPITITEFRHEQMLTPDQVLQRIASVSHVAVLPSPERESVLDQVRSVIAGQDHLALPYRVDCVTTKRV